MAKLPVIQHQVQRAFRRIRLRTDKKSSTAMPVPGMEPLVADANPRTGIAWYRYATFPQDWILASPTRRGADWLFLPFDRVAWFAKGPESKVIFDPNPSQDRIRHYIPGNPKTYKGHWLIRCPKVMEPPDLPKDKSPMFILRNQSVIGPAIEKHFGTDGAVWATKVSVRAVTDTGIWFTNPAPPKAIHDPDFTRAMRNHVRELPGDELEKIKLYE